MQELNGTIHGKTIELEEETGLADGQAVVVSVRQKHTPGEGLRRSAGGWADAGPEFDEWLAETMRARRDDRAESGA